MNYIYIERIPKWFIINYQIFPLQSVEQFSTAEDEGDDSREIGSGPPRLRKQWSLGPMIRSSVSRGSSLERVTFA